MRSPAITEMPGGVIAAVLEPRQPGEQQLTHRAPRRSQRCRTSRSKIPAAACARRRATLALAELAARRARPAARRPPRPPRSVGASTITRTSGSVPLGRISTRPRPASASSSARRPASTLRRPRAPRGRGPRTLTRRWGASPSRRARQIASAERLERQQRAGDAVAGAVEAHLDDVPGLLAAERPAACAQLLEHVAVADARGRDRDARRAPSRRESRSWSSPSRRRRRRAGGRCRAGAAPRAPSARRRRRPRRASRPPARGRRRRRRRSRARGRPSRTARRAPRRGSSRSRR